MELLCVPLSLFSSHTDETRGRHLKGAVALHTTGPGVATMMRTEFRVARWHVLDCVILCVFGTFRSEGESVFESAVSLILSLRLLIISEGTCVGMIDFCLES